MHTLNIFNRTPPFFLFDKDDSAGDPPAEGATPPAAGKTPAEEDAQAKLNKEFAERAERAAQAERKKLLTELGVEDPEQAKALLKAAKELEDAKKTELEKAEEARRQAEDAAVQARTEAEKKLAEARTIAQNADIKIAASAPVKDKDGKVVRPAFRPEAVDDVLLLIKRDGIEEKDGKFDGIENALAELAKAKPWMTLEDTQKSAGNGSPREPQRRSTKSGEGTEKRVPLINSL